MQLLTNNLHKQPLLAIAVELVIKDVLPRAEMELAVSDRYNDLPTHDLSFQVGIGVIFKAIVLILAVRFLRGQLFQPDLIVVVQARFVVVNEHAGGNVHSRTEHKAVLYAAILHQPLDFLMYGHDSPPLGYIHPYFFGQVLHNLPMVNLTRFTVKRYPNPTMADDSDSTCFGHIGTSYRGSPRNT